MIAYDTMTQVTIAALCLFLRPRWVAYAGCGIFFSQALDEALAGNLFGAGRWEYPFALVYTVTVYLILRRHDSEGGK